MQKFTKSTLSSLLMSSALGLCATAGLAEDDYILLDTITVIGTGLPTEVMENPASITVISAEELKNTAPVSIATLLRDVPGLQINEEGIERVSIRGETSRRLAIMIDGQKLIDHTNYGQPILVDPTTIDRIEVVRGSSSVVSGSRAIGGVINIITKKGADKPFELSTTAGYMSATEGYRASASASGTVQTASGAGALDYRLDIGKMDQGNRKTPYGELDRSAVSDDNLAVHLGYRTGNHYFGLKGQAYDLAAEVYTGDEDFIIDLPNRDLRKLSAFYEGTDLTPWLNTLHVDAYHQTIDREFSNDVTVAINPMMSMNILSSSVDEQETSGLNIKAEMKFSANSRTLAGIEYEDDALTTDKQTVTTVMAPVTTVRHDEAKIRTLSVYGQHEISLSDTLTANLGARWYDVSADHIASVEDGVEGDTSSNSDSLVLGAAGLVWSPNSGLALRANLSQGYIYPTLGQMFLTTTGGGVTLEGNPDLKPERATTFELGARYNAGATTLDATLFYTDATDYIATVSDGTTGTYENVDQAKSWGLEVYAEHDLDLWQMTPYVSLSAMRRQLHYANGYMTFDSGTPDLSGKIGLRKDWTLDQVSGTFDLYVRGESGVSYRDDSGAISDSTAGYGTLNLRTDMDFGNGLSLVAEMINLTDRSYTPYGQMPGAERSINLFLTKTF